MASSSSGQGGGARTDREDGRIIPRSGYNGVNGDLPRREVCHARRSIYGIVTAQLTVDGQTAVPSSSAASRTVQR